MAAGFWAASGVSAGPCQSVRTYSVKKKRLGRRLTGLRVFFTLGGGRILAGFGLLDFAKQLPGLGLEVLYELKD